MSGAVYLKAGNDLYVCPSDKEIVLVKDGNHPYSAGIALH